MKKVYVKSTYQPSKKFYAEQINKETWEIHHQDGKMSVSNYEFEKLFTVLCTKAEHIKQINKVNFKYSKFNG